MAKLGLAYDDVRRVNPRLIYCGMFGFGQDGRYRGKPALHEASAVKALVGLSNLIADAGDRIASIDINPFLINARTGVAVDALIVLNNAAAKRAAGH